MGNNFQGYLFLAEPAISVVLTFEISRIRSMKYEMHMLYHCFIGFILCVEENEIKPMFFCIMLYMVNCSVINNRTSKMCDL